VRSACPGARLASFPVYTSKAATDASYLECRAICSPPARRSTRSSPPTSLHGSRGARARPAGAGYEFQRLHGMASAVRGGARRSSHSAAVRVYARGTHESCCRTWCGAVENAQQLLRPSVHEPQIPWRVCAIHLFPERRSTERGVCASHTHLWRERATRRRGFRHRALARSRLKCSCTPRELFRRTDCEPAVRGCEHAGRFARDPRDVGSP